MARRISNLDYYVLVKKGLSLCGKSYYNSSMESFQAGGDYDQMVLWIKPANTHASILSLRTL